MKKYMLLSLLCLALTGCSWFGHCNCEDTKSAVLFNGRDFAGWAFYMRPDKATPTVAPDPMATWSIKDGVIACTGKPTGYMRTEKSYKNYRLHVEYRWSGKPGNSGIIVHATGEDKVWPPTFECQNQNGNAGDFWLQGGAASDGHPTSTKGQRIPKQAPNSEKPAGEWNDYDIVCKDGMIRLIVNGVKQNELTGANPSQGYIGLQSEGAPVEFRNIKIDPIK